jgi:ATP-dependent DNA helicase RecG
VGRDAPDGASDRILDERGLADLPAVEAVYGLTEGLSSRMVGKFVGAALEAGPGPAGMAGAELAAPAGLPGLRRGAPPLHRPGNAAEISEEALMRSAYRRRLAYDELLASQLTLALVRSRMRRLPGG